MKIGVVGAGVGGLSLALSLIHRGITDIDIYEASKDINELGVGINILPHALRIMDELGLMHKLIAQGVEVSEMRYLTHKGQLIRTEARGRSAGYRWPQISIHRGKLISILHNAVIERLGYERIHTKHKLVNIERSKNSVILHFDKASAVSIDCLIGCDGIHSIVRNHFYPLEGAPKWDGITMWRGVTAVAPDSIYNHMTIAGHSNHRMVVYPISKQYGKKAAYLINWVAKHKTSTAKPMPKQDWLHQTSVDDIPREFNCFEFLKSKSLFSTAHSVLKYPQVDRDPLPSWNFAPITLLGDAAHPMYPSGSNGASQAIIDGEFLSDELAGRHSTKQAIENYDANRRRATSDIVLKNRQAGPEKCIDVVEDRAPNGFNNLDEIIAPKELDNIVGDYKRSAGFEKTTLNKLKNI